MGNLSLITILIIAANVALSFKGFKDYSFFERYKFNIGAIQRGEKIRYVTSAFLHADTSHLLFNMLTLYFFADVVIYSLGNVHFTIIYMASLLGGNLLSYYFHQKEYYYSAIGASGAVTGVLYAAIVLYPEMSLYLFFIPIPIPGWLFGVAYLLYSLYGMKRNTDLIGHDAHFGGAVTAYCLTLLLAPQLIVENTLTVLLLAIPIILLLVLKKLRKI